MSVELEHNTDHSYSNDDDHIDSLIQNDKIDSLAKNSSKSDDSNTNRLDLQTNNSLDSDNKDRYLRQTVKTGDIIQVAPWLTLSIISFGSFAGLEFFGKKRKLGYLLKVKSIS